METETAKGGSQGRSVGATAAPIRVLLSPARSFGLDLMFARSGALTLGVALAVAGCATAPGADPFQGEEGGTAGRSSAFEVTYEVECEGTCIVDYTHPRKTVRDEVIAGAWSRRVGYDLDEEGRTVFIRIEPQVGDEFRHATIRVNGRVRDRAGRERVLEGRGGIVTLRTRLTAR